MDKIQSIVETGIYVDDLDQAEAFYHDLLGLPVLAKDPERHIFFQVGQSSVLLAFLPDASLIGETLPPHGSRGPSHFAFGIAARSLEHWRRRLAEHDIPIEKEMRWPRGGKSIYFRDPAGNSVELITPGLWGLPAGW